MFEIDDWDDPDFDLDEILNADCDDNYYQNDNDLPPLRPPATVANSVLTPTRTNTIPSASSLITPKIEPYASSQPKPLPQIHTLPSKPNPNNTVTPQQSKLEENSQNSTTTTNPNANMIVPPPPPPIVISPAEVDHITITLEKNQQCACKDCGKLFNSVWYLKQHAVKHSNDRPFKCKFCLKTYKFRSNLYQHKCPERNRQLGGLTTKRLYTRGIAYTEIHSNKALQMQPNGFHPGPFVQHHQTLFEAISGNPIHTPPTFPINPMVQHSSIEKKLPEPVIEPIPILEEPKKPNNCIREQPLDQAYVDNYIAKHKHKLFPCRKCKILFPNREYLSRHMAYHNYMDSYEFECSKCPQRFQFEKQLVNHMNLHSDNSPHRCLECESMFRSSLSLRRHRDQCRACIRYPFGIQPDLLVSQPTPLDQYAFIESDEEDDQHNIHTVTDNLNRQKSAADSGLGSDSSTHSLNNSPNRNHNLDDEFDDHHHHHGHVFHPPDRTMLIHKNSTEHLLPTTSNGIRQRKSSEETEGDDVDSGFRSRLNSSIPSCSPGSSGNGSEAGTSPARKFSTNGGNLVANDLFLSGYNSMAYNYHNGSKPMQHQHQAPTSAMNYGRGFDDSNAYGLFSYDNDDLFFSLSQPSSFDNSSTLSLVSSRVRMPRVEKIYFGKESLPSTFISDNVLNSIENAGDNHEDFDNFGYDLIPFDLEDIAQIVVQLFLRSFIVVVFDALIQRGLQHQRQQTPPPTTTPNHTTTARLQESIFQNDVNNESNTKHANTTTSSAKHPSLPSKSDEDGPTKNS